MPIVIGGAGDIGAAISNQFCDLGATVTATGANDADLARTLLKPRAGLTLGTLDVTDDAAVKFFANKYKRVDALVNCAGILARDKEFEIETFVKVLDVNLTRHLPDLHGFSRAACGGKGIDRQHRLDERGFGATAYPRLLRQ